MSRALREPLLHFLILGALLFAVDRRRAAGETEAPVVVTDGFVEGLRRESLRSTGQASEDDAALVRAFLREEALVRRAESLGLAEGDVIVRRRLAQKMEFLLRSTAAVPPPTDAQLLAFLRAHPGRYRTPPRITFRHVYFDRSRRVDAVADAARALERLATEGAADEASDASDASDASEASDASDASDTAARDDRAGESSSLAQAREGALPSEELGDPFLRGYRFPDADLRRVESELGARVAGALREAPLRTWVGPVEGALGVHLLRVEERTASREPTLAEVHAAVASDWEEARRDEALEAAVTRLVEELPVERRAR